MFKSAKRKKSDGFTLAEVLIVVAIIGILLAVAIPNVIAYYRTLKLTELDDSARSIFVAAQNRLTAMKSAGQDLKKLSSTPIKVSLPGGGEANVLAVSKGDAGFDALVPGGAPSIPSSTTTTTWWRSTRKPGASSRCGIGRTTGIPIPIPAARTKPKT